jgi:hypothetical protein
MNPKQFADLHAKCWDTLKHYVHEADRMCELFSQCCPEPSSIQIRSEIIQQRILENNAYSPPTVRGAILAAAEDPWRETRVPAEAVAHRSGGRRDRFLTRSRPTPGELLPNSCLHRAAGGSWSVGIPTRER